MAWIQIEDRISGLEGNVVELQHSDADKDKIRIKHNWNMRDHWNTIKRKKPMSRGQRRTGTS
jgi:hypothetical protein